MKTKPIFLIILISTKTIYAQTNNTTFATFAGSQGIGQDNTFIGHSAGLKNKGDHTTSVGLSAGMNNVGAGNSFFGKNSGFNNVGSSNSFFGVGAGSSNNKADFVTAFGAGAGGFNKGSGGVFVGNNAGSSNKGLNNTAIGFNSGGNFNLAVNPGMSGEHNTFLGAFSGEKNTIGMHNTYIGAESGRGNQLGIYNTFLGMRAGGKSTGSNNVFIGYEAGNTITASHKLVIAHGISSSTPLITGDFRARHVAIGGFGDSKFTLHVLGTAHTTGTFTSSDKRFKQNIRAIDKPLEKLLAVKGVSYEFKKDATRNFPEGKTYGFIAQDVQKILPSIVKEDKDGYLALNYECFIPLLVEGFKEMQGDYKQLSAENAKLRKELDELKKIVLRRNASEAPNHLLNPKDKQSAGVTLYQNEPNPFTQQTSIRYQVAPEAQNITLNIYDQSGMKRLQYPNLLPGTGEVKIQAGQLPTGIYVYNLAVDGKVADSKRMVLTR